MEAARVVHRNSGDGSRLYGRGCFSFGGLVCSHLPIFFILIVERMDGSCAKIPKLVFFFNSSLCPLHLYAQTTSKGFG